MTPKKFLKLENTLGKSLEDFDAKHDFQFSESQKHSCSNTPEIVFFFDQRKHWMPGCQQFAQCP